VSFVHTESAPNKVWSCCTRAMTAASRPSSGRVLAVEMTAQAKPLPYVKTQACGLHAVMYLPMSPSPVEAYLSPLPPIMRRTRGAERSRILRRAGMVAAPMLWQAAEATHPTSEHHWQGGTPTVQRPSCLSCNRNACGGPADGRNLE